MGIEGGELQEGVEGDSGTFIALGIITVISITHFQYHPPPQTGERHHRKPFGYTANGGVFQQNLHYNHPNPI